MPKKRKKDPIQQEEEYIAFLEKRLNSKHFKANVSEEEFEKTKEKYKKAKFRLRILKIGRD